MAFCRQCGVSALDRDRFCRRCGTQLAPPKGAASKAAPPPRVQNRGLNVSASERPPFWPPPPGWKPDRSTPSPARPPEKAPSARPPSSPSSAVRNPDTQHPPSAVKSSAVKPSGAKAVASRPEAGKAMTPKAVQPSTASPVGNCSPAPPSAVSRAIGNTARRFVSAYQQIPILSAPGDAIRAKNGIQLLVEELRQHPEDPERYLWMSEAIVRAMRDGLTYGALRSIVDPSAIVETIAIRAAARAGLQDLPEVALRKSAFALSVSRLRTNPTDTQALYVLGRIYLIQGDLPQAIRFSWLATVKEPTRPVSLVTAANAFAAQGDIGRAGVAAWAAVERGSSMGYSVLAQLALRGYSDSRCRSLSGASTQSGTWSQPGGATEQAALALHLRRHVTLEDRDAYLGPRPHGVDILHTVMASQKQKLKKL